MKVLIADDDPSLRFLCRAALEGAGHEVLLAEDGSQVLDAVRVHYPGLVLMDVSMPYMGGLEVLKKMPVEERDVIPVILLSARSRVTERVEGIEAGAIDYITKPFDPMALVRVVEEVLGMSADERRRYRFALLERLRAERVRHGISNAGLQSVSIDLRDGQNGATQSLPRDGESRRAARRQTAVASLALSAVAGAGVTELIDEMTFTAADILAVRRVAVLEMTSHDQLICRSAAGDGVLGALPGKTVTQDAVDEFLSAAKDVHLLSSNGIFVDGPDHFQEVWVAIPGCSGQSGVIAVECESDECLDSDDLRFLQVSAGILSSILHPGSRHKESRHISLAGFMRKRR